MLHTYTITPDELIKIEKRKYAVLKTDLLRVEGDGIVFTLENTRTQLQAVITDVNQVFKSQQVLSLDNIQITGVEAVDDTGDIGAGPGNATKVD
jgi:hypothetical protein